MVSKLPSTRCLLKASREGDLSENMANADSNQSLNRSLQRHIVASMFTKARGEIGVVTGFDRPPGIAGGFISTQAEICLNTEKTIEQQSQSRSLQIHDLSFFIYQITAGPSASSQCLKTRSLFLGQRLPRGALYPDKQSYCLPAQNSPKPLRTNLPRLHRPDLQRDLVKSV